MRSPSRRAQLVALAAAVVGLVPLGAWSSSPAAATSSTANLLTGDTATLDPTIGTWVARNGTARRAAPGVLALTSTATDWALVQSGSALAATAARPGNVYTGTFSVRADSKARSVSPALLFLDAYGNQVGRAVGQAVTDARSSWSGVVPVTGIAPANATGVLLAEFVASPAVGEVHYLRSPSLVSAVPSRRDVVGPLRTSGNQVLDANGPLVLRGIHRRGLELAGSTPISTTEIAQAKRWGATMIRLSLSSSYWLSSSCSYSTGYATAVDAAVQAVTSRHMVALLDLHTFAVNGCGTVRQQPMADVAALDFWRQVAARYRSNPLVAFDLYNEPHDISDSVWLNGGQVVTAAGTYTAAGMQQLYDAVRSAGAANLVVVSGNDWANRLPSVRVVGQDLLYGVHVYTCPTSPDPLTCSPDYLDPSRVLQTWVGPSATVPVAVTEFGWPTPADGRYNANVIAFAESHGWGWDAFAWDGRTTGDFSLLATLDTYEPSPNGMPVLRALGAA